MSSRWRSPWRSITRAELRERGMVPMPAEVIPDSPAREPESPRCDWCRQSPRGFCDDHRKSYNVMRSVDAGKPARHARFYEVM